ncbi:MAG: Hpt domain-containing protein [Haliea sp.]|jgi:HPt (histidine-containing phosphotransfer) domain-containing protein|nr:Hpt domain-containing protein [Haliea sp.]MDP4790018.1 Hpt domain-containing protein [Haliea sp.]MDP4917537.1 Hpt domain-containing protein [Haliea sp.]MDP5063304.1 Hpt domain-containing protein [Haliea sp.]
MTTHAQAFFDSAHLPRSLELDDWEILEDFYLTFLHQIHDFLSLIEGATSHLSIEEQRHHAHKLGSSCRTVGAPTLAGMFETLENLCRNENTDQQRAALLATIANIGEATRDQVALHLAHAGRT